MKTDERLEPAFGHASSCNLEARQVLSNQSGEWLAVGRLTVGDHFTQIVNTEERVLNIQGLHPPHGDRMRHNRGFAGLDTTGESWVDMNSVGAMESMGRGGMGRNLNDTAQEAGPEPTLLGWHEFLRGQRPCSKSTSHIRVFQAQIST